MAAATATFKVVSTGGDVKPKVDSVVISPAEVKAGSRFNISFKVGNTGSAPMTGNATVGFSCPGNVCIRDSIARVSTVPAGGSVNARTSATMPANAPKGNYKVTITYTANVKPPYTMPGAKPPYKPGTHPTPGTPAWKPPTSKYDVEATIL